MIDPSPMQAISSSHDPQPGVYQRPLLAIACILSLLLFAGCGSSSSGDSADGTAPDATEDITISTDDLTSGEGTPGATDTNDSDGDSEPDTDGVSSTNEEPTETISETEFDERTCRADGECRGGEICRDQLCRTACAADILCEDENLSICDEERGYCVRCLDDETCGDGRVCDGNNRCAAVCESDTDCSGDRLCETDLGYCVARECTQSSDCPGGNVCTSGLCISLSDRICTPNETRCLDDENTVEQCNRFGTVLSQAPCDEDEQCASDTAGVDACLPIVCTPNTSGCDDSETRFTCDESGTLRETIPCDNDFACSGGLCRAIICEPGEATCDGASILTCNDIGVAQSRTTCASLPECAESELGCGCEDAQCQPRVCVPESRACDDDRPTECSSTGLDELIFAPCDEDSTCRGGECVDNSCEPGTSQCAGETLVVCPDGQPVDEEDCMANESYCQAINGSASCEPWTCTPGSTECDDSTGELLTCSSNGSSTSSQSCGASATCRDGECRDLICTPNDRYCIDDNVFLCSESGLSANIVRNCGANNRTCSDGECQCRESDTLCETSCVDTETDARNCGGCGVNCGDDGSCVAGSCICAEGLDDCGNGCIDTTNDGSNCGTCGRTCDEGETCRDGSCTSICTCYDGETFCGPGECGDDPFHGAGCCVSQGATCENPGFFGVWLECREDVVP